MTGCEGGVGREQRGRGFTLIEMIITLVIMSIVGVVGVKMISSGFSNYLFSRDLIPLATQGQVAMERMSRELQGGICSTLSQPSGAGSVQFDNNDPAGTIVLFKQTGSVIYMNNDILAQDIKAGSLLFALQSNCVVQIDFRVEKTSSKLGGSVVIGIPLRTAAYVRN
ncbi:MAG: prepilin-type N-terminal cleavage/methylation domain-containing protein [Magnetococcales bacterium]|nr:prepilin-type N-terminal cleavage/methylation domain-containing protein [Magnetococcales bacterium]